MKRTDLSDVAKNKLLCEDEKLNKHFNQIAQELTAGDITAFLCFSLSQMLATTAKLSSMLNRCKKEALKYKNHLATSLRIESVLWATLEISSGMIAPLNRSLWVFRILRWAKMPETLIVRRSMRRRAKTIMSPISVASVATVYQGKNAFKRAHQSCSMRVNSNTIVIL